MRTSPRCSRTRFKGRFTKDGKSSYGGWRPEPGREGPENVAYDERGSRIG
jgi:hypothetical protein